MASKSIDWDELLLTADPKKKEIEVSFKKIDGEGNLISKGDQAGTPGGATEDENGTQPEPDDEGDFPVDPPAEPGDGGPAAGQPIAPNPETNECTPQSCTAYTDYIADPSINPSIAITWAYGPTVSTLDATGFADIDEQGTGYGNFGRWSYDTSEKYYENQGGGKQFGYQLRNARGDYLPESWGTNNGYNAPSTVGNPRYNGTKAWYIGDYQDIDLQGDCGNAYFWMPTFASFSGSKQWSHGRGGGFEEDYYNQGGNDIWVPLFETPGPTDRMVFNGPREGYYVEEMIQSQYLCTAVYNDGSRPYGSDRWGTVVPTGGKYSFNPSWTGGQTFWAISEQNNYVGNRQNVNNIITKCTLDYDTGVFMMEGGTRTVDGTYTNEVKEVTCGNDAMTNCWITTRFSYRLKGLAAINGGYSMWSQAKTSVSIDGVTLELVLNTFDGVTPNTYTKFFHPQGNGSGDNNSPRLFFRAGNHDTSVTYNDEDVAVLCAAVSTGPTTVEMNKFKEQFTHYNRPAYCERVPEA